MLVSFFRSLNSLLVMVNSVGGSVLSHQLPVRGNGLVTRYTIEAGWAAGGGLVFVLRIKNYETFLYTTEFLKK